MNDNEKNLIRLFQNCTGEKVQSFSPLPLSGSSRRYYRITGKDKTLIGAVNNDLKENKAFIYLSRHFKKSKLNVPKIEAEDLKNNIYLVEDLGDSTLFELLQTGRKGNSIPEEIISLYKKAIEQLAAFQFSTKGLDFAKCYPRAAFDVQSIMWDLNYFKYYFLKLAGIEFNEQLLENDFALFTKFLLSADSKYFLYRDMNSRNIMVKGEDLYFIDYQGGRKGALQYDIASLLYDAKANLPQSLRDELLDYYLYCISKHKKVNKTEFLKYYYGFVLIRIFQALGAYGFRGYFERKDHFLKSIPYAVKNLEWLVRTGKLKIKTPYILDIVKKIIISPEIEKYQWSESPEGKLKVSIVSFSYRDKIPIDLSGNGGGFVFDCRGIVNPGRYEEFKPFNGMDKNVQDFLDNEPGAKEFIANTASLIEKSIESYLERGFSNLMVSFGCTGGQHRSVYSAERMAQHLAQRSDITIELKHTKFNTIKLYNNN